MKKSELKNIIREEIKSINEKKISSFDSKFVDSIVNQLKKNSSFKEITLNREKGILTISDDLNFVKFLYVDND